MKSLIELVNSMKAQPDTIQQIEIKTRGSKRNVSAGHDYERACRDIFRNIGFPHVTTSRAESRNRDNQKIDLINKDEEKNGRLPYNIQCKTLSQTVNYHNIFHGYESTVTIKRGPKKGEKIKTFIPGMSTSKDVIDVILHKYTEKELRDEILKDGTARTVEVFMPKGYYAIMKKRDFLMIVAERLELIKLTEENKRLKSILSSQGITDTEFEVNL